LNWGNLAIKVVRWIQYSFFSCKVMMPVLNELMLFIDGSVNTRSKAGYGAYLCAPAGSLSFDPSPAQVKLKRFEHTSSTRLELQTLLWALGEVPTLVCKVTVYTDSQNIIGLQGRRNRLENNKYLTKKNKLLNNHDLYREFFRITDQFHCTFVKVPGHQVSNKKDGIDRFFTLVDRASRSALRNHVG
jgi:ribonuclease HI